MEIRLQEEALSLVKRVSTNSMAESMKKLKNSSLFTIENLIKSDSKKADISDHESSIHSEMGS